jgi:hypothetical protein
VAGEVASALEDCAFSGQLHDAGALIEQLEALAGDLVQGVEGLSIEQLRLALA